MVDESRPDEADELTPVYRPEEIPVGMTQEETAEFWQTHSVTPELWAALDYSPETGDDVQFDCAQPVIIGEQAILCARKRGHAPPHQATGVSVAAGCRWRLAWVYDDPEEAEEAAAEESEKPTRALLGDGVAP